MGAGQVIYPLSTADAIAKEGLGNEVTQASRLALEQRLDKLMEAVRLSYLVTREGGWGAQTEWGETLSLGTRLSAVACGGFWPQLLVGMSACI